MTIFSRRFLPLFTVLFVCAFIAKAQEKPIGYWRSFLPYNTSLGLATDGNSIFNACTEGFFTLEATKSGASPVPYSKVEGMSDIGMQCVAYDAATSTTILVYVDGNIDLFKGNANSFYNIPDLEVKVIAGSKTVNQVYTENGIAYLSTDLGILVLDLTTHNFNETYYLYGSANQTLPVTGFTSNGDYFYAATSSGLFRADKNSPQLQNFQVWQNLDTADKFTAMASVDNTLFLSNSRSVYALMNDTVHLVYTCPQTPFDTMKGYTLIKHIDAGNNQLLISEFRPNNFNGDIKMMDTSFRFIDSMYGNGIHDSDVGCPVQALQLLDNTVWFSDAYYGLSTRLATGYMGRAPSPPGPSDPYSYDIYANNKDVYIAHGGYDDLYYESANRDGVSHFTNDKWVYFKEYSDLTGVLNLTNGYNPFDTLVDFVSVLKDESNGNLYFGSFNDGLSIIYPNGNYQLLRQNPPSIFDSSTSVFHRGQRQVIGLATDQQDNLWVTLFGSQHSLYAKSALDSSWHAFRIPGTGDGGPIAIDDYGQVWFVNAISGGVTIYNTNGTLNDSTDDSYYHLGAGVGTGNLPSSGVYCIAKDKNDNMWIGTDNGIGIASNCTAPFQNVPPCDAEIPIVQYDQFAGYLFAGSTVRTIAVDGANRKWVGTDNGVWLLSPDAAQIIYRFTSDNSPMPSNTVRKIAIDKVTGDVYIGTDMGMVCYRSTATDGGTSNQDVLVFPNPIASDYSGTVAIKGLVANADVRITDINGQLVYRTTAYGGQATWNGKDYTGRRPQSGVYLIFVSSSDGSQTYAGKMVFMK